MADVDWEAIASRPAELVLVAGPNGSGKTTITDAYIRARFPIWPKLNADRLLVNLLRADALQMRPEPGIQAAQIIDTTAHGLSMLAEPFVLETVLSSPKYKPLVTRARTSGLIFRLVYVITESPRLNVERVRQRVRDGGHDVPADRIQARWYRSLKNLEWFIERADRAVVVDNSGTKLRVLGLRHLGGQLELRDRVHPASASLLAAAGQPALER